MKYLWTNYDSNSFYYSEDVPNCPWEELVKIIQSIEVKKFEINPLIRFSEIFLPLFEEFRSLSSDERHEIENILYHFLAQIDRHCGKHKFSFVNQIIAEELSKNFYGETAGEIFRQLEVHEQRKIADLLRRQEKCNGRKLFYTEAIKTFFPNAKIYFYEDEQKFLIYIPQKETKKAKLYLKLINILFLEVSCLPPEIFWNQHFGIVGEPETMLINQMIIY